MTSVTISASFGARGERIGRALAERLGLAFLDRAIPLAVARRLDLSEMSPEDFDERAPSFWDRFIASFSESEAAMAVIGQGAEDVATPEDFRAATEAVLREAADGAGAVILGRAGMVVLRDRDDVLRVRLDGPLEKRIAQAVADGIDEKAARQMQREIDAARERYVNYFYKAHQHDARLYHLVLDTTAFSVEVAVDLIERAARAIGERDARPELRRF
jgi:cytidylate kinase